MVAPSGSVGRAGEAVSSLQLPWVMKPSKENVCIYVVKKSLRVRGELEATETKVITPGKIVPYKCCLPSSSISVKKDFDTDFLFN